MAGTTSVSTCRPAYGFRRTCGKSILGTEVLGNAVLERTTNFVWPAVQQVRDLCVYFLSSSFLLLLIFFTLYMTYRIGNQSINHSINIEHLGNMGFTTISLSTPQPLNDTIVGVQANFRVSYPIRVISRVKCIDYIRKGVLNSHLGSNPDPCYIQNYVITNRVIKRFGCSNIKTMGV